MTSTSGTVCVTSGLHSGHQSVVEQRAVVKVIASAQGPGAGIALSRGRAETIVGGRGLVLAAAARQHRPESAGGHVGRPSQLPDVRVAILSLSATGSGGRDAV